jgi:hypothetical protein
VVTDNGYQVYGMELPWKDNKVGESCILAGDYECAKVESAKFGLVYKLKDANGRTDVLFHPANWIRQLLGCIALGRAVGLVLGIKGVMSSRDAVDGFMADLEGESFVLTIQWEPHLDPQKA